MGPPPAPTSPRSARFTDVRHTLVCLCVAVLFSVGNEVTANSDAPLAVQVTTDKLSYHRGESIVVTIHNELAAFIYAPRGQSYCSVVSVQRLDAEGWVAKDSCAARDPASDPRSLVFMAPKSKTWGTLGPAAQGSGTGGRVVSRPVTPSASTGNLPGLLPAEPWRPGESIPEIPEGEKRPPFSALDGALEQGTYRVEFTFTVDSISGPKQTVYSKAFTVTP